MYECAGSAAAGALLRQAHALIDAIGTVTLTRDADDELLTAWHSLEGLRRKLSFCENRLIGEIDGRGVATERGVKNTQTLGAELLRITSIEALHRVRAAQLLGPQRRFGTGEEFPALFPQAAAAQAAGEISPEHARVITKCIKALPAEFREKAHDDVEALMVKEAAECDPDRLVQVGQQVHARLNPDGTLPKDRARSRGLDLHERADGSGRLTGELTAEATARFRTVLDAFTHPRNLAPAAECGTDANEPTPADPLAGPVHKDGRPATARRHDAFLAMLKQLQSDQFTPTAGGLHTQLVITIDWQAYATGKGLARTGHGRLIPARDAIAWAGGNPRVIGVALDNLQGITAYSTNQRIFTEAQRLAIIARDGGCSFPGCAAPPQFCEIDHIIPWATSKRTSVDDGHLVCTFNHRYSKEIAGWTVKMINGRPGWIPPPWLDPDQNPRFNTHGNRWLDLKDLLNYDDDG